MACSKSGWLPLRSPDEPTILALFDALPLPLPPKGEGAAYSANLVPGSPHYRVGKDSYGTPLLLIDAAPHVDGLIPVALEHLQVRHGFQCEIQKPNGVSE